MDWPATRHGRSKVWAQLTRPPFVLDVASSQGTRARGLARLLDWLESHPGETWQERWLASGAEAAGAGWAQVPIGWLHDRGQRSQWLRAELASALGAAICADLIRPSLSWLVSSLAGKGALVRGLARARDLEGFARLRELCAGDPGISKAVRDSVLRRTSLIVAAKGGRAAGITVGDVLELLDAEAGARDATPPQGPVFYRLLHQMGIFGEQAPARLREFRTPGQLTPDELIDRYQLACRPVRDLLVDYLRERQPALAYKSLKDLSYHLGKQFWQDLEHHHPGIDSLHLPREVADAWKQRQRTKPKTITAEAGEKTVIAVERISYRQGLTPVRAFYLDLSQWAIEDPGRWGPWVTPCPVSQEETSQRKFERRRKARMDARTRERLPVLPILVRTVSERRKAAGTLLEAARQTQPGDTFTADGQTLTRSVIKNITGKIWADDPASGKRRDLGLEDDHAFWAWAAVEVLRLTGIRMEELLEITHHSLIQYRLPTTGELVPLLQIAPSKTDEERLLVVSPELADVLSAIIRRVRGHARAVPLVPAYDRCECVWQPPSPVLFQRRFTTENRAISDVSLRTMLNGALAHTGLADPTDGLPLHYTPHDFRRIFITDAIMSGLPPHIAQIIAGHRDLNVTMGYTAVYPEEAIQAHLAFLARRRSLRPGEEYRTPTDEEWTEFLGHFELRKVATGTCGRAFGTPCIHEHDPLTEPTEGACGLRPRSTDSDAMAGPGSFILAGYCGWCVHLVSSRVAEVRRLAEVWMPEHSTTIRDIAALAVARAGRVEETSDPLAPFRLVDEQDAEVPAVTEFLHHMLADDASPASLRSYAYELLVWFRFLAAVGVAWDLAGRPDARDFALWLKTARKPARQRRPDAPVPGSVNPVTGKATPGENYAARTRRHARAVIRSFYEYHREMHGRPLVNPFPQAKGAEDGQLNAHYNPMRPFRQPTRRAAYQPKEPRPTPRSIPDQAFNDLFAGLACNRDRALIAFYISTGARASELLGARRGLVAPEEQTIGVIRKGSRALQHLPASADAFVWLRLYQQEMLDLAPRGPEEAVWWTLRRPFRPLTYDAARMVFTRVNRLLGANWTLHDLRHSAAKRMVRDPHLTLADVQWVLGHAHITTTEIYTAPAQDEVIAHVLAHHERQRAGQARPPAPPAPGYRPEVLAALFGSSEPGREHL